MLNYVGGINFKSEMDAAEKNPGSPLHLPPKKILDHI